MLSHGLSLQQLRAVLELTGYKKRFIAEVVNDNAQANRNEEKEIRSSTCIPYVKGFSEKIKCILIMAGVRVAFKPVCTLANIFRIPKARPSNERTKAVVYKCECRSCSSTYTGESKRCWCSR